MIVKKKKDQKHKRNITIPLEMKISVDSFIKFRLRDALYSYNFFFLIYMLVWIYIRYRKRGREMIPIYT